MNLSEGIIFLIAGLIIILYNFWNNDAILFIRNLEQISASLNTIYILFLMIGFFFIGAGTAQAAISLTIYKLEKKIFGNNNEY